MPVVEDVVISPCVRSCCLDDDRVCVGCGRTIDDIRRWGGADAQTRRRIVAEAAARRAAG